MNAQFCFDAPQHEDTITLTRPELGIRVELFVRQSWFCVGVYDTVVNKSQGTAEYAFQSEDSLPMALRYFKQCTEGFYPAYETIAKFVFDHDLPYDAGVLFRMLSAVDIAELDGRRGILS